MASHSQALRTVVVKEIPPCNVVLLPIWYKLGDTDQQEPKLMVNLSCVLGKGMESGTGLPVRDRQASLGTTSCYRVAG